MKRRFKVVAVVAIAAVASVLLVTPSQAEGPCTDKPIRLYANESYSPIGTVNSFGVMRVDGRLGRGGQHIWGGELLEAAAGASMTIALDSIGQVTMKAGAIARLSRARATLDEYLPGNLLVASLVSGAITVRLRNDAGAYVEASGEAYTASQGATFRLRIRDGMPAIDTISGDVRSAMLGVQQKLNINPLDDRGRPLGNGAVLQVRLRTTRDVQWQVTDENGRPVPDIPIVVTLASTNFGTVGSGAAALTATTGANGIAAVPFSGTAAGSSQVTGQVSGTQSVWTGQVHFTKPPISPVVKAGIAAGAAAGAGLGAYFATRSGGSPSLGSPNLSVRP